MSLKYKPRLYALFILLTLALLCLCSCGTFKRAVNKSKDVETKKETEQSVTTRTTVETIDTTLTIKQATAEAHAEISDLINGDTITSETDALKISVSVDPVTKKVKAKATRKEQRVPVEKTKVTIERKDHTQQSETKKKHSEKKANTKIDTSIPLAFWLFLLLLAALVLWWVKRNFFPLLPNNEQ